MERHRQRTTSHPTQASGVEVLTFSDHHLDTSNACLHRGEQCIRLQRSTCALLKYLATHPGQLVSRDELHESLWPNVVVGPGALNFQVRRARSALGDNARRPRFIETVHRMGYRFLPRVQTLARRPASPGVPTTSTTDSPDSLFVGRRPELARMAGVWRHALRGQRGVISIEGETGIGKTRLVDEFLKTVGDAVVLRGRCIEHYGPAEPYGPILSALEQLDRAQAQLWAAALAGSAHSWQARLPTRFGGDGSPVAPALHTGMIREMQWAIGELTRERPMAFIVEDLQWADPATWDLLRNLTQDGKAAKLVVIATYRPSKLAPQPRLQPSLVSHLPPSTASAPIELDWLSLEDVERYLQGHVHHGAVRGPRVAALHASTGGNPLFLRHVVQDLMRAAPALVENASVSDYSDEAWLNPPEAVVALIRPELHSENEPQLKILQAASLVGRCFDSETVATAVQLETTEVERQCLSWARRGRYLRRAGPSGLDGRMARSASFEFIHDLCRQVIIREVGPAWRKALERRLGQRQSRLRASLSSAFESRGLRRVST